MATIVEKVIGTGGDYTTLQAWEDACPANLVTADQVWRGKVKNQVFSIAGTVLTVSGTTVDSTRYVELTTDTGASFLDHANVRTNALRYNEANGACIKGTGAWAGTVVVNQNYTRISRLQFSATDNGSGTKNTISIGDIAGAQYCDINQCIFEGYAQAAGGSGGGILSMYGTGNVVRNSLIVQKATPTSAVIAQLSSGASARNCTFVSLGATLTAGIYGIYGAGTLSNCYIGGVSAPKSGSASLTVTTSHTDATASGYTTTAFSTATFENITIGTHDLRLKSGAGLIDVGTTDATYAASDISGLARSGTYDVGAWEVAAGGGTNYTLTLDTGSYSITGENLVLGNTSSYVLSLDAGSYNIQSFPPVINIALGLDAENYILNGNDLTLSVTSVSGNTYSLVLEDGIYVGIGQDIGTILSYNIQLDQGTYSLDGKQVRLVSSTEPVILVNGNHTISISLKIGI